MATEVTKLLKINFTQATEANLKFKEINQQLKYHQIADFHIIKTIKNPEQVIYKIQAQLTQNLEAIASQKQQAGRFK